MSYNPTPIDTSSITLPPELEVLVNRLAENTHDVWARQRFLEGWRYGPSRSDAEKTNPCLVPFDRLPSGEQGQAAGRRVSSVPFDLARTIPGTSMRIKVSDSRRQLLFSLCRAWHRSQSEGW